MSDEYCLHWHTAFKVDGNHIQCGLQKGHRGDHENQGVTWEQTYGLENHVMKLKLEALKEEVNRKDEEIRQKENYLMAKIEELKMREGG